VGAKYITLLWSYEFFCVLHPPVKTGGYKYCAPLERMRTLRLQ
jgi:hypothetical protein